jgi:hypothetical protein
VNSSRSFLLALPFLLTIPTAALTQDLITVDTASVVADVSRKPIGININFLLDDDANRTNAIQSLADALKEAGVRYLAIPAIHIAQQTWT